MNETISAPAMAVPARPYVRTSGFKVHETEFQSSAARNERLLCARPAARSCHYA